MIETAWQLGGLEAYDGLNLRRWAHMLGFRGHFLTKSRALLDHVPRHPRRAAHLAAGRDAARRLDRATDDPNDIPPDLATITVVNDWSVVHIGHHNDAERELAHGHRRTTTAATSRTTRGGRHEY